MPAEISKRGPGQKKILGQTLADKTGDRETAEGEGLGSIHESSLHCVRSEPEGERGVSGVAGEQLGRGGKFRDFSRPIKLIRGLSLGGCVKRFGGEGCGKAEGMKGKSCMVWRLEKRRSKRKEGPPGGGTGAVGERHKERRKVETGVFGGGSSKKTRRRRKDPRKNGN